MDDNNYSTIYQQEFESWKESSRENALLSPASSLEDTKERSDHDEDDQLDSSTYWLFGYGSLMWDFPSSYYREKIPAILIGYER